MHRRSMCIEGGGGGGYLFALALRAARMKFRFILAAFEIAIKLDSPVHQPQFLLWYCYFTSRQRNVLSSVRRINLQILGVKGLIIL